jgi:hypothetical protein
MASGNGVDEAKPVNGQINLAKRIPEFAGKVLGPWLVPAPDHGVAQYRYSETPVMTALERASIEPPAAVDRPPMQTDTGQAQHSRWTGEPLGETAGVAQNASIGQSH